MKKFCLPENWFLLELELNNKGGLNQLRVGYSVLREINVKNFIPCSSDYGITQIEFENFILFLEHKGYVERVLRVNDKLSLNPARLTEKGIKLLENNKQYIETYPKRNGLKAWVQIEKEQYSNGAEEEYN